MTFDLIFGAVSENSVALESSVAVFRRLYHTASRYASQPVFDRLMRGVFREVQMNPRMSGTGAAPLPEPCVSVSRDDHQHGLAASRRSALKVAARLYTGSGLVISIASRSATAPSSTIEVDRQGFESQ